MLLNVVHVNVNVTDVERSVAFYEKVGFRVMHVFGDPPGAKLDPDGELGRGMANPGGGRVRGAVMSISDDPRSATKLELIEWVDPPAEPQPERPAWQAGVSRIAIRTKNLAEYHETLRARGIEFESEPVAIDVVGARRYVLFRDPDGTLLELIEF